MMYKRNFTDKMKIILVTDCTRKWYDYKVDTWLQTMTKKDGAFEEYKIKFKSDIDSWGQEEAEHKLKHVQ